MISLIWFVVVAMVVGALLVREISTYANLRSISLVHMRVCVCVRATASQAWSIGYVPHLHPTITYQLSSTLIHSFITTIFTQSKRCRQLRTTLAHSLDIDVLMPTLASLSLEGPHVANNALCVVWYFGRIQGSVGAHGPLDCGDL